MVFKQEPKHVLMVEDNPGDAGLVEEAFRAVSNSIKFHLARDGVEAIKFLKREGPHAEAPRPNLVLLDLNLPMLDGRQVLSHAKGDEELKSIPIVVLTVSNSRADIDTCYQYRANSYIVKPYDFHEFEGLISAINTLWITGTPGDIADARPIVARRA